MTITGDGVAYMVLDKTILDRYEIKEGDTDVSLSALRLDAGGILLSGMKSSGRAEGVWKFSWTSFVIMLCF
jgi:hypothetical protein